MPNLKNRRLLFVRSAAASAVFLLLPSLFYAAGRKDAPPPAAAVAVPEEVPTGYTKKSPDGEPVAFGEIWGWVMQNRERELDFDFPLTDVGYFAAEVNSYGELSGVPARSKLNGFSGRVHLVLVCDSRALTHFVLEPRFGLRQQMLTQIMNAARTFDGVQVDYELIPARDAAHFLEFLTELSRLCKNAGKMFTVCVPARLKTIANDAFPYRKISAIADRVIIMAYDEHWSTSRPGPIASVDWCGRIVTYAKSIIPAQKLVMGLPFYGRTWASEKTAQGWYFSGMNRIMRQYESSAVEYVNDIPKVEIDMKVHLVGWFEDAYSTVAKLRLYSNAGVQSVAFWRIGQEDPEIWKWLQRKPVADN